MAQTVHEPVFRAIHDNLLQNFSGRTFGNIVERGENAVASDMR